MLTLVLAFAAATAVSTVTAYTWPSPQLDALEAARFDAHTGVLLAGVQPCDGFGGLPNTGRSNAADWVRTAYHDMATHNIADGTGGLDGSIRFEEERLRPENPGDGFNNTLAFLSATSNRYISIADSLALAAVIAIETCGGPEIPFRGNRIDATSPNSPGVPEPQQDIDSHIGAFARQGFNKEEMIGLVACGHTFGGVEHQTFPQIVPEMHDPKNKQSVQPFDSTFVTFDNNVATEYMSDTTQNPLVVALNDTFNSDKRIFGSDGNVTMKSFADSPSHFSSTCASLIARMIDTVPKGVQLTDVLEPLPIKPADVELQYDASRIKLSGNVRLWNTPEDDSRSVRLLYTDHLGGTGNLSLVFTGTFDSVGTKYTSAWYAFAPITQDNPFARVDIDPKSGIKSMSFIVNGKLEDQGGVGFAVEDRVMRSTSSCRVGGNISRIDVAVRTDASPLRVYVEELRFVFPHAPTIVEHDVPRPSGSQDQPYTIWSLNLAVPVEIGLMMYHIGAEFAGGVKYSTTSRYSAWASGPICADSQ
ncbi:peroxidase [Favolaschia claudopus]|uniref:Peroxidase n=1 Tax=Favolaschia claudopus TaxID=2862362 RepID=A0AAW0CM74_9AGAR